MSPLADHVLFPVGENNEKELFYMKQKFPLSLQLSFRKSARQVRNRSKGRCPVWQTQCCA